MVTESGLKLRTRLESAKTLKATTDDRAVHTAGSMIMIGDTIGVVVEDVGPNSDFVLVYSAEKIVVPKIKGAAMGIGVGEAVYFDKRSGAVGPAIGTRMAGYDFIKCGRALEDVDPYVDEALIDLMVLE